MGKFSRQKGSREERALVAHLKDVGFEDVKRVPLSGAAAGFKGDVWADRQGKTWTFELKTRNSTFGWLYKLYTDSGSSVMRLKWEEGLVALGYDPASVSDTGFDNPFKVWDGDQKLIKRIFKLKDLKQDAHYLVLKDNHKKRLFLRFW